MSKGQFIVLEGIDGTGKTTLARDLGFYFNSLTTRMPGGSPFAEKLRGECRNADISDPTQVLFYSALLLDCHEKTIIPAIEANKTIISDRNFGSTFAYQAFPKGHENLLLAILENSNIAIPDLTLYIDVDLETALEREAAQDRVDVTDRYSKFDVIQKEIVKEAYDKMYIRQARTNHIAYSMEREVAKWKIREKLSKRIEIIDGCPPYRTVLQACKDAIEQHIQKYK